MTTLIQDVQALLQPLAVGGAWFGFNTQQPPVYPYITWLQIVTGANVSLRGASALQNTRVQVDAYALNVAQAEALAKTIASAFAASALQQVPLISFSAIDPDTRAYRICKEFSIWATN